MASQESSSIFDAPLHKFGQPALDLGCGASRILIPMLADGFDVDGSDVSADMIAEARGLAVKNGYSAGRTVEPMRELDLARKYRTTSQVRLRLWSGGQIVKEEEYSLSESLYFAQEVLLLVNEAGSRDIALEGGYTGRPAPPDDGMIAFVAGKPA